MPLAARLLPLCLLTVIASAAPGRPEPLEVRTHDFSDLILSARPDDQPDPTPRTLSADMPIGSPSPSRSEVRQSYLSIVRETIDPTSWAPKGPAQLAFDGDGWSSARRREINSRSTTSSSSS